MAAICGAFGATRPNADWDAVVDSTRMRSAHPATRRAIGLLEIVVRGDAEDLDESSGGITTFVDGSVDNLSSLCERHGVVRASGARALSELFRLRGTALFAELEGSFAVVVADETRQELHLVRDRYGTKPLCFARSSAGWAFASECAMLLPLLGPTALDRDGLAESLHYRWLVGDRTLFSGIEQVLPASAVVLPARGDSSGHCYYRHAFTPALQTASIDEWADQTEATLRAHLGRALRPGAKVAVLLSGGVDSSLLGRLVAEHVSGSVLFTPTWKGFDDPELPRARQFALGIGAEHRVLEFDGSEVDPLFAHCVARLEQPPRHHHVVTLAAMLPHLEGFDSVVYGEAADTMFGPAGIGFYQNFAEKRRWAAPISFLRAAVPLLPDHKRVRAVERLLEFGVDQLLRRSGTLERSRWLARRVRGMGMDGEPNARIVAEFYDPLAAVPERLQAFTLATEVVSHMETVDRLFTPVGLDIVTPFLSPEIVELATTLPSALKGTPGRAKPVLKHLSARYFGSGLANASKLGFPTPARSWLNAALSARVRFLQSGSSPMARVFGKDTVKALSVERDLEAVWTLIALDELVRKFGLVPDQSP